MAAPDGRRLERARLRALFINEGATGPGVMGQGVSGQLLSEQFGGLDMEARHLTLEPMGRGTRLLARAVPGPGNFDLDAQAVRWHLTQAVRARRVLRRELRRTPADVVHLHGHTLALLAAPEMRRVPTLLGVDVSVWDWHAMGIWRRVRGHSRAALAPSMLLERRAFAIAARVIALTEWSRRSVERAQAGARVVVLPSGIDVERFRPVSPRPRKRPRLLFVGGRFVEKGGPDLIDALGPELGAEVELDIVTPEPVPERPGVRVHRFAPGAPGLVDLYQQADVFCLPTHGDAAPLAVLEAMACGTPVVGYDVGAIGELLGAGTAGCVVPAGDRRALRAEIMRLLADPGLRRRLGAGGRSLCERRNDVRVQVRRLAELMREVVAEHSGRA
jgi:glycosyltransferase involved in cell wall biosynthesis